MTVDTIATINVAELLTRIARGQADVADALQLARVIAVGPELNQRIQVTDWLIEQCRPAPAQETEHRNQEQRAAFYRTFCIGGPFDSCYSSAETPCQLAGYDGCQHPQHPRNLQPAEKDAGEAYAHSAISRSDAAGNQPVIAQIDQMLFGQ